MCSSICNKIVNGFYSCGAPLRDACCTMAEKVKEMVTSPVAVGQVVLGAVGWGVYGYPISTSLGEKVVAVWGMSDTFSDSFAEISPRMQILLSPFSCVVGPIIEECAFRGQLQEMLKDKFESFYTDQGFSSADIAARVTSVFFTAIIFGLLHFSNALFFWRHPVFFLPQVVLAMFGGLISGLSQELSGGLYVPCGIHIANNTLTWAKHMSASL